MLRGFKHQTPNGVMREHETEKLLADEFGCLAAQDDMRAAYAAAEKLVRETIPLLDTQEAATDDEQATSDKGPMTSDK